MTAQGGSAAAPITLHATCVALSGKGVLLLGPSGCGKSDLALRLIEAGAVLVADDRVILARGDGGLVASCPAPIAGRIEVRGVGICSVAAQPRAPLALAVELAPDGPMERLPETRRCAYLGVALPLLRLAPFEVSAPIKLRMALEALSGRSEGPQ